MSLLLREAIGGSIRRARTERRRTLRDVSHSARVSLGYLSEIERGRKEPSSELLAAICDALALPLPDLLDDVADALRPVEATPRRVAVVDPALRSAVEAALEPVREGEALAGGDAAGGDPAPETESAPAAEPAPTGGDDAGAAATMSVVPGTGDEPAPAVDDPDETDDEAPRVRLVGVVTVSAPASPVVRAAA